MRDRHQAAAVEYEQLTLAAETTPPPCRGDDRFVDDQIRPADVADVCNRCPIYDACRAYATAARPTAGIWAGRRWTRSSRKD